MRTRSAQSVEAMCCRLGYMQHTVHMDELFAMSEKNTNESCKQDVCDTWQTADSDELFAMRNYNRDGQYNYFVCDSVCTKNFENAS